MTQRTPADGAASAAVLVSLPDRTERRARTPGRSRRTPAPAADDRLPSLVRELPALLGIRGVSSVCVVDEAVDRVVGACGTASDERIPLALVEWARGSDARPDDVMITTSTDHHLLQRIPPSSPANPGTATAWVYLHLVREHGIVEIARRALASLAGTRTDPAPVPLVHADPRPVAPAPDAQATVIPLPLPRRAPMALPPPPRPSETPQSTGRDGVTSGRRTVLDSSWSTDVSTMQRLLNGLRRLA